MDIECQVMRQEKALSVDKFLPGSSQDWQYKKRVEEREAINTTWPSARHAPLLQVHPTFHRQRAVVVVVVLGGWEAAVQNHHK